MKRFFSAILIVQSLVLAQSESFIAGLSLNATSGNYCNNLTGTNPPSAPRDGGGNVIPDRIQCNARLAFEATFRGEGKEVYSNSFTKVSGPDITSFTDSIGNQMNKFVSVGDRAYCRNFECYTEYSQDGSDRARWYQIEQEDRLMAINGNRIIEKLKAVNFMVDGKALSAKIGDGSQYLEVPIGEYKEFNVEITDFNGGINFNDGRVNPIRLRWINPNPLGTPHSSIPSGISFKSVFANGKWTYALAVDGQRMDKAGLYVVNYSVQDEIPIRVEYMSFVEGLRVWNHRRYLEGVVIVAYGLSTCAADALSLPDYTPAFNATKKFLKHAKKPSKRQHFAKLSESQIRFLRDGLGRPAATAGKVNKALNKINLRILSLNIVETPDSVILKDTAKLDEEIETKLNPPRRLIKQTASSLANINTKAKMGAPYIYSGKALKAFNKRSNQLSKLARKELGLYHAELRSRMELRTRFRSSNAQCNEDQNSGS